jgi:formylglycine-generating enzyme required for sulfatase activity
LPVAPSQSAGSGRRWRWAGLITLFVVGVLLATEAIRRMNLDRNSAGQNTHETAATRGAATPTVDRPAPKPWPADAPPPANVPFDGAQAVAHQQAWADYLGVPLEHTNSLGMKLRLIPPGEFVMGSPPEDVAEALANGVEDPVYKEFVQSEAPQHRVRLSQPWYMGVHEVTQEQYEAVCGSNPSYFSPLGGGESEVTDLDTQSFPVEQVSWNQSAQYCNALSRHEGLPESYSWQGEACTVRRGSGYSLPTEAQWEFACRAGTQTGYALAAAGPQLRDYAWFKFSAAGRTHAVGELRANSFGLHDLLGNVSEWCQDGYLKTYYARLAQQTAVDPTGPSTDFFFRNIRGANISLYSLGCRSAKRIAGEPNLMQNSIGLRIAISVDGVKTLLQAQQKKLPAPAEKPLGPEPRAEPP